MRYWSDDTMIRQQRIDCPCCGKDSCIMEVDETANMATMKCKECDFTHEFYTEG